MKLIVTIALLCLHGSSVFGQSKEFSIGNHKFKIVTIVADTAAGETTSFLSLQRDDTEMLKHIVHKEDGDCSSFQIELGKYKLKEDKIVFYTYWAACDRQSILLTPYGFRKQVYTVDAQGKVSLAESIIYIEDDIEKEAGKATFYENWAHKGLKLLNQNPKNANEKEILNDYISNIEKKYNSKFVLHKEKAALENEVRQELKTEIATNTGDWVDGEVYGTVKK